MGFDLGNLLQNYMGGNAGNLQRGMGDDLDARALDDFDTVAQNAPRETVAQGVTEALRSDQTPPFPSMVGNLFNQGDSHQRAGMLNQLLGSVGPSVLASLAGGLGGLLRGNEQAAPRVTPEQAATMSPAEVQQLAAVAEQHNPGVVDRMGSFYAEHPNLVKGLGGAALAIALGHIAQGMRR